MPTITAKAGDPGQFVQPQILFWDDAGAAGNRDEWYMAFRYLGLVAGVDYDIYYTNGPAQTTSHGLGGRSTAAQLAGYADLVYTSGVQGGNTLAGAPVGNGSDGGDDVGVLTAWLNQGGKDMLLTGDDLAGDLFRGEADKTAFLYDWIGVDLADENVLALIGPQTSPMVQAESGNPVFTNVDEWRGVASSLSVSSGYYGGGSIVTGTKRYDAVQPRAGAQRLAQFLDQSGAPGAFVYSAATLNVRGDVNARIISFPYDFQSIWTPATGEVKSTAPLPARAQVLQDILTFFGRTTSAPSSVPDAGFFAVRHYPNPFNPRVTISYNLPRAGQLSVKVYDIRGRLVRDLSAGRRPAGPGQVAWDGRTTDGAAAAAGVYFYEARSGDDVVIGKMALIK